MGKEKSLFLYAKDKQKEDKIERLCKRLGIKMSQITGRDLDKPMHRIAGINGIKPAGAGVLQSAPALFVMPEVMVFSGFSDSDLDEFLMEYRKEEIEPIGLKAILTPYNVAWSLYQLIRELQKEQQSFLIE